MPERSVAIAVVPRERFSATQQALETLYQHTPSPFTLIYVDGGSPKHIRQYLEAQSRQRGFRLLRTEYYLPPNQARNLAFRELSREVDSKYVVFIDNDVLVSPGWLSSLVGCAEDTGGWLVGPLYYIGQPQAQVIHMAGGLAHINEEQGKRKFSEKHRFTGRRLGEVRQDLRREPCELVEFHCMLARTEALKRVGPLDERLLTDREHIDLCMTVRKAGGDVYFEPNAQVVWLAPPPIAWSDLPYFMLRWSEAWNLATARRFRDKWRLSDTDTDLLERCKWLRNYRHDVLRLPVSALRRVLGWRLGTWVALTFEWMFLSLVTLGRQQPPQRS